jgi:hypothetical protein
MMDNIPDHVFDAARRVAETTLADMREMVPPDQFEDGYDLNPDGEGGLWIQCSHDVVLHVNQDGEQDGRVRPVQPLSELFEEGR